MKKVFFAAILLGITIAAIFFFLPKRVVLSTDTQITTTSAPELTPKTTTYRLQFGHDMPEASILHRYALRFADIVDFKSKGQVHIEVIPNQQLGTDQKMIEMARSGELAIILPPTAKMSTLVPEMQVLDVPFLFNTRKDLYDTLDGEPGQALLDLLAPHGLIGVAFWESGFKQFTANRPIQKPEDFQGLNIRVMKSQTIMDQFKAYGANPVIIDFHRTYQALKDGVVDGQENPLSTIVTMKFDEVQSHLTLSNHAYIAQAVVFSKKIFDPLPADIRRILVSSAKEITPDQRRDVLEKEVELGERIKEEGVQVHTLTPEERQRFVLASAQITAAAADRAGKILPMIQQYLAQKYKTRENEIILGLNADMTAGSALSGQAIFRGMELAADELNEKGGVLGKKLRIIVRDNSGISGKGLANMEYFSTLDNLVAVFCGIYSPIAIAQLDIVHRQKIIFLDPWAAATNVVDNGYNPNYVFRVSVRDEYAASFLVEQAIEKHTKIALLLVDDGWGRGNAKRMTQALAQKMKAPVAVEFFNWGEKSMDAKLERIEKAGADVIVLVANAVEGGAIIKSMSKRKRKLPIIAHWGITGGNFWESVRNEIGQVSFQFLQTFSFFNPANEKTRSLLEKYFQTYSVDHPGKIFAPAGTAHAFDLVHLLAAAIVKAGRIDREAVRDALEQLDEFSGVVKEYSPPFTPQNHDALDQSSFFLAEYDNQGYIIPAAQ